MSYLFGIVLVVGLVSNSIVFSAGCRLLVPADLINGCIFDPMIISVPSTQYSVNRETCNSVVQKDVFTEQPIAYYPRAKLDRLYTVMMIDPDAPNHRIGQFYLHWLVINVPGIWMRQGTAHHIGDTVIKYVGPSPPVFSGPHRYMIIAYEQVEPIVEPTVVENRARFELMNWIESIGGEKLLRGPISSVAFISEY